MDIYPFIDSQAIREHLQKLDYHFNAEEGDRKFPEGEGLCLFLSV